MAFAILVAVEIGAGSHLPPQAVNYLDGLLVFLGVLSLVLSIMRRLEKR